MVQKADNSGKDAVAIGIADTNFSSRGWAILQVVY